MHRPSAAAEFSGASALGVPMHQMKEGSSENSAWWGVASGQSSSGSVQRFSAQPLAYPLAWGGQFWGGRGKTLDENHIAQRSFIRPREISWGTN